MNVFYEDIYFSLDLVAFGNRLPFIQIYPFSEVDIHGAIDTTIMAGAFVPDSPFDKILLNMEYLSKKPVELTINIIHHEMVHFYCELNNIKDTSRKNGYTYHNKAFKRAVERNGGVCRYTDNVIGYNSSELKPEIMKKVLQYRQV